MKSSLCRRKNPLAVLFENIYLARTMKTTLLTLLAVMTLSVLLSGCNTMRGVGQDVSAAGRGIQRAAR